MGAHDWIKMRTSLLTDGRVRDMARALGVTRYDVVGRLLAVWSVADIHATDDGFLRGYTIDDIDEAAGMDGFAAAMPPDWLQACPDSVRDLSEICPSSVRDLSGDSGQIPGMLLPNYVEHNTTTSKKRQAEAKAKSRNRARARVRPDSVRDLSGRARTDSGPEERREEKSREEASAKTHTLSSPGAATESELATGDISSSEIYSHRAAADAALATIPPAHRSGKVAWRKAWVVAVRDDGADPAELADRVRRYYTESAMAKHEGGKWCVGACRFLSDGVWMDPDAWVPRGTDHIEESPEIIAERERWLAKRQAQRGIA